jgi:PAS domain S-box-containing protein
MAPEPTRTRSTPATDRRRWLWIGALAVAGLLLNLAPVEVFPGIHFVFGAAFALVAAVRYGPVAGGLVGFVAALPTWSLWSQPLPLSALLYGLEGVWVGIATRGGRRGPLAAALAYWLLLGSWLNLAFQLAIVGLSLQIAIVIQCRSIINGLLVAMVVELGLLAYHAVWRHRRGASAPSRRPTFQSLVALVLTALISLPILGITIRNGRSFSDQRVAGLEAEVERGVQSLRGEVGALVSSYSRGVATAAEIIAGLEPADRGFLQGVLGILQRQYPELAGVYIADPDARALAIVPLRNERGEELVGASYADRAYYRELLDRRQIVISGAILGRGGTTTPAVVIAAPVLDSEGELAAFVVGGFDLRRSFQPIVERFADQGAVVVIADREGMAIADSRLAPGGQDPVRDLSAEEGFRLQREAASGTVLRTPAEEPGSSAVDQISAGGAYVLAFATEPSTGWRIWIRQSLAPIQEAMLASARTHLLFLIVALLLALALSRGLARLLARPLERLQRNAERLAAGDLSARPEDGFVATAEVGSLYRSFSQMADGLDQAWQRQRQLLDEVSVTKRELEATFDAMTDAVVITDGDDRVLRTNRAFCNLIGEAPERVLGEILSDLTRGDGRRPGCAAGAARPARESATVQISPEENVSGRWVEVRVDQLRDGAGRLVGAVQVIRDITEEKAAEERVRRDDKLRALGQLAAGVAHNFNNALTAVLGYTQLARSMTADPALQRNLEIVEVAALDAAKMVRRIQQFARAETDEPLQEAHLDTIIDDALELTRSRWESDAQAAGIRYEVRFAREGGCLVQCDSSGLREVFVNLIINALDAMPEGGTLEIETRWRGATASVTVSDSGGGMSETVRERIFEPFFTTKGAAGQGLGLAVSYGTIERHRGHIQVASEPGRGSVVTVTLPVRQLGRPDPPAAALPAAASPGPPSQGRVLVVEDEEPIRGLVAAVLESEGFEVETAADGEAALRRLASRVGPCGAEGAARSGFDLVLTDLAMPGADGMAVAREVRRSAPATRVILMTGYGELRRQICEEWGGDETAVDAWLSKPFDGPALLHLIEEVLHPTAGAAEDGGPVRSPRRAART